FFFQAEDGIRDSSVTGVQTCALPISVLDAVAEKIGWGSPAPEGVYRGLAQLHGYGSYVAGAAEISVIDGTKIKIHRIVASTDPRSEERRVGKQHKRGVRRERVSGMSR